MLKLRRREDYFRQNIKYCHVAKRAAIQIITVKIAHGIYNLKMMKFVRYLTKTAICGNQELALATLKYLDSDIND